MRTEPNPFVATPGCAGRGSGSGPGSTKKIDPALLTDFIDLEYVRSTRDIRELRSGARRSSSGRSLSQASALESPHDVPRPIGSDAGGSVKQEGEAPQTQPPSQPGDDSEDHRRQSQSSAMEVDEPASLVCGGGAVSVPNSAPIHAG
jgi:hypothetical protein